jgi:hypothetical protein
VQVHDVTVNAPLDPKFRRLNVSFYEPSSDYSPPAPFLFKPALALVLGTGFCHLNIAVLPGGAAEEAGLGAEMAAESDAGRLLAAFTQTFWAELSAGG